MCKVFPRISTGTSTPTPPRDRNKLLFCEQPNFVCWLRRPALSRSNPRANRRYPPGGTIKPFGLNFLTFSPAAPKKSANIKNRPQVSSPSMLPSQEPPLAVTPHGEQPASKIEVLADQARLLHDLLGVIMGEPGGW